jgi:hypothetical protein
MLLKNLSQSKAIYQRVFSLSLFFFSELETELRALTCLPNALPLEPLMAVLSLTFWNIHISQLYVVFENYKPGFKFLLSIYYLMSLSKWCKLPRPHSIVLQEIAASYFVWIQWDNAYTGILSQCQIHRNCSMKAVLFLPSVFTIMNLRFYKIQMESKEKSHAILLMSSQWEIIGIFWVSPEANCSKL